MPDDARHPTEDITDSPMTERRGGDGEERSYEEVDPSPSRHLYQYVEAEDKSNGTEQSNNITTVANQSYNLLPHHENIPTTSNP